MDMIPSGRSIELPPEPRSSAHTGLLAGTDERIINLIFGLSGRRTTRGTQRGSTRIAHDDKTGDVFVVALRGQWRGALILTGKSAEIRTYDLKKREARVVDFWEARSANGSNSRTIVQPWSERKGYTGPARETEGVANFTRKARLLRAIAGRMSKSASQPA